MAYFNDSFMNHRKQQWLRSIHAVDVYAKNDSGSVVGWYRGDINQKKIDGDTLVIMATFPMLDNEMCTITASRIIDVRGEEVANQTRNIQKNAGQGTMIKITIPIYEVTA